MKTCECGCGSPAPIATKTNRKVGNTKGQPQRYVKGHYNRTHGHNGRQPDGRRHSRTYLTWMGTVQRCTNPKQNRWKHYGGAGVKMCKAWLTFEGFLASMGERPEGTTLGRYKDTGDYKPSNCAWMTRTEQGAERSKKCTHCKRGHARTPDNVTASRNCKACEGIMRAQRRM
jgi:hypothetical protein